MEGGKDAEINRCFKLAPELQYTEIKRHPMKEGEK